MTYVKLTWIDLLDRFMRDNSPTEIEPLRATVRAALDLPPLTMTDEL